ncbi:sel1 repeat family protein [Pseudoalteromonas sp. CO348]|uniref:tetratricopeptide repeat protein n=1 Tax=unclassified Pseudoalteromonas TaxID=194690 RepID=UPI001022A33B|nr:MULTISPECIES: tetratricopeptide repeat protein [unclassified Pseudoalteromonas]MCG7542276.1 sel1 repeat family protein [Pseudoalteromonas sp. OF7H-1]RZG10376.1 sel1 repeat family protein [Pseudoalteromonas sp. CO348]
MEIKSVFFSFYDTIFNFISKYKLTVSALIVVTIALYFYNQYQQQIASYQTYLASPQIDDLIIFDAGKNIGQAYDPAFQVLQITELTDDNIEVKESAYTYRTMRNITRDIRVSMLMTDHYFKPQRLTLEKDNLLDLLDDDTIVSVYRPVGIHVLGGVVRQRFKKPKPLYNGPKISAQNQEAIHAYSQGNFEEAKTGFAAAAKTGNPWAQYNYGTMLRDGEGGAKDIKKAIHWLKLAAEQGNHKAQTALAKLCQDHPC